MWSYLFVRQVIRALKEARDDLYGSGNWYFKERQRDDENVHTHDER